ncbi:MAG: agmatinase [Phycisphaerales bacterium]
MTQGAKQSSMRTVLPDARVTPRFAGVCTFCRFPMLDDVPESSRPVDWVVYGVPFDAGVTFRPGARFGPRAIRDASQYVKPYSIDHDVNVCEVLSVADGGDAPIKPFALKETLEGVCEHAIGLSERGGGDKAGAKLLAVGGDHSIAYANMKATWVRQGKPAGGLALVHFDSHLDTVDITGGEKWSHASPFIRAVEDGILNPRKMLSIGVKGPLNSGADLDYARARGITLVTYSQWQREGAGRLEAFVDALAGEPVYLTFDIDCVDPAFAPGTGTPSVGGFTSAEALRLVRSLSRQGGGLNVVGADVVEVLPDRDVSQITSLLAGHVIFEVLCLSALHRRAGG